MRLHCEVSGDGKDLVLLHGWGMNLAVWEPIRPQLEQQFRVWRIELPGHGASDYDSKATRLEDWTNAVLEVAPERAHWLGWSLGGQIAMLAALICPERIDRLALVASSPRFVQGDGWPHAVQEATLRQFAKALLRNPAQTLERFLSLQVRGDDRSRELLRLLRQEIAARPVANATALEQRLAFFPQVALPPPCPADRPPLPWPPGTGAPSVPARAAALPEARGPRNSVGKPPTPGKRFARRP